MSWLKVYEYILLHFLIFNGVYRADYGKEFSKYKKNTKNCRKKRHKIAARPLYKCRDRMVKKITFAKEN